MTQFSKSCPKIPYPQLNGIFVLDKPSGPSSTQCLRIFKRLGQKKIGHAGTLDPLASGVLLVLLGQATKLSNHILAGGEKIYRGTLKLGEESDTWDIQGNILCRKDWDHISPDMLSAEVQSWKQRREQEVPPYSAARHNGKRLYVLARKSLPIPQKVKQIAISQADILNTGMPYVDFRVTCSSGSYIRSLAHSLGKRLGCGAILCKLTREYSHPYSLSEATKLEELKQNPILLAERLMPLQSALPQWKQICINQRDIIRVKNGIPLEAEGSFPEGTQAFLCMGELPVALASIVRKGDAHYWTIIRGLWN